MSTAEKLMLPDRLFQPGTETNKLKRINRFCGEKNLEDVKTALGNDFSKIKESFMGPFIEFIERKEVIFSRNIVHYLLQRRIMTVDNQLWFAFGEQPMRFGLREFALTTGLKCCEDQPENSSRKRSRENKDAWWMKKPKKLCELVAIMQAGEKVDDENLRLGALIICVVIFISSNPATNISIEILKRAKNFEEFCGLPWGKISYQALKDSIMFLNPTKMSRSQYFLCGFNIALQFWAMSSVKQLGMRFGIRGPSRDLPLCFQWVGNVAPSYREVAEVAEIDEVEVTCIVGDRDMLQNLEEVGDAEFEKVIKLVQSGYRIKRDDWVRRFIIVGSIETDKTIDDQYIIGVLKSKVKKLTKSNMFLKKNLTYLKKKLWIKTREKRKVEFQEGEKKEPQQEKQQTEADEDAGEAAENYQENEQQNPAGFNNDDNTGEEDPTREDFANEDDPSREDFDENLADEEDTVREDLAENLTEETKKSPERDSKWSSEDKNKAPERSSKSGAEEKKKGEESSSKSQAEGKRKMPERACKARAQVKQKKPDATGEKKREQTRNGGDDTTEDTTEGKKRKQTNKDRDDNTENVSRTSTKKKMKHSGRPFSEDSDVEEVIVSSDCEGETSAKEEKRNRNKEREEGQGAEEPQHPQEEEPLYDQQEEEPKGGKTDKESQHQQEKEPEKEETCKQDEAQKTQEDNPRQEEQQKHQQEDHHPEVEKDAYKQDVLSQDEMDKIDEKLKELSDDIHSLAYTLTILHKVFYITSLSTSVQYLFQIFVSVLVKIYHGLCEGCGDTQLGNYFDYYGGYRCDDCDNNVFFHKECAESPFEINHPSHSEHPLQLTEHPPRYMCDECGNYIYGSAMPNLYHCSICDFNIDTSCARKPPLPLSVAHPNPQELPYVLLKEGLSEERCRVCKQSVFGRYHYGRISCDEYVHVACMNISEKAILLPFHPDHPLELNKSASLFGDPEKACLLCGVRFQPVLYYCSTCDFSVCFGCVRTPPPLLIDLCKTHEHHLTLSSGNMSFTCNVCGMDDDGSCYLCLPCGFMAHRSCINMPQVVIINRHDHRLSRTNHLGPGYSDCGVCRQPVNQFHGAYSCSICPKYAVHSQCATTIDVWDGIDLEGIPEEVEHLPFKVVGDDNLINHFSHEEHNLRLTSENVIFDETARCEACVYPLNDSGPIYSCEECDYFLHEKCANLPMKRRHLSHRKPFTLHARGGEDPEDQSFVCMVCQKTSTGFRYISGFSTLDVHCSSVSEPFVYDGHSHPLYYELDPSIVECDSCHNQVDFHVLKCDVCEFSVDFSCATLRKA